MIARNGTIRWDFYRPQILKIAFCISLVSIHIIINLSFDRDHIKTYTSGFNLEDMEITPVRTHHFQKPKKKLPQKIILVKEVATSSTPIKMEKMENLQNDQSNTNSLNLNTSNNRRSINDRLNEKLSQPIEKKKAIVDESSKPFIAVEHMPSYGDCKDIVSEKERRICTNKAVLNKIYDQLKYPALARENGIDGTVVIEFVINKTGEMKDIKILRDIGAGCGKAAMNAIKKLRNWSPGKQQGRPVNVLYRIPVKYKLQ